MAEQLDPTETTYKYLKALPDLMDCHASVVFRGGSGLRRGVVTPAEIAEHVESLLATGVPFDPDFPYNIWCRIRDAHPNLKLSPLGLQICTEDLDSCWRELVDDDDCHLERPFVSWRTAANWVERYTRELGRAFVTHPTESLDDLHMRAVEAATAGKGRS